MHDIGERDFEEKAFELGESQLGYISTDQLRAAGYVSQIIAHHARIGTLIRVHRGVYRLRKYPSGDHEEIMAAWLAVGRELAVVSHESALELYDLSDVIPAAVHLTIDRAHRYLKPPVGTTLHTVVRPLTKEETTIRQAIRVTSVPRTLVDCLETGIGPDQIEMAVAQALERGITTPARVLAATEGRAPRIVQSIESALARASN